MEDYTPIADAVEETRNTVAAAVDGGAGPEDVTLLADLYRLRRNVTAYDPVLLSSLERGVEAVLGAGRARLVRGSVTGFGRHVPYTDLVVPHPGPWARDRGPSGLAYSLEYVLGHHSTAHILLDNEVSAAENSQSVQLLAGIEEVNRRYRDVPGYVPLRAYASSPVTQSRGDRYGRVHDYTELGGVRLRIRHQPPYRLVTVTRGHSLPAAGSTAAAPTTVTTSSSYSTAYPAYPTASASSSTTTASAYPSYSATSTYPMYSTYSTGSRNSGRSGGTAYPAYSTGGSSRGPVFPGANAAWNSPDTGTTGAAGQVGTFADPRVFLAGQGVFRPLGEIRPYVQEGESPEGRLRPPRPEEQTGLERVFPVQDGMFQRYPDPRDRGTYYLAGPIRALNRANASNDFATDMGAAEWVRRVNARRETRGTEGRLDNCMDVARSVLASWYGVPTVAAATAQGIEDRGGRLTSRWLDAGWRDLGSDSDAAWESVRHMLLSRGHGSAAMVIFQRPNGNNHAVVGVNHRGRVLWIDGQRGRVGERPLYEGVDFRSIELDPQGRPIDRRPTPEEITQQTTWAAQSQNDPGRPGTQRWADQRGAAQRHRGWDFDVRRFFSGRNYVDVTVRVALRPGPGVTASQVEAVADRLREQVEVLFNAPRHRLRLSDGERLLHVTVQPVDGNYPEGAHWSVEVTPDGTVSAQALPVKAAPVDLALQLGRRLGLRDIAADGADRSDRQLWNRLRQDYLAQLGRAIDEAVTASGGSGNSQRRPSDNSDEFSLFPPAFAPGPSSAPGTRAPRMVTPAAKPVPLNAWWSRRAQAAPAPLYTESYDPARRPDAPRPDGRRGLLSGRQSLIRARIRRIQAADGRWVRDLEIALPVRPGEGFTAEELPAFEAEVNALLNQRVNTGFTLPASGDQLHMSVRLIHAPHHRQAVEISRTERPGRSDQLHFRLHTAPADGDADAGPRAANRLLDDNTVLHELFQYSGVPDRYFDPESLYRNRPDKAFTTGVMADLTTPADGRLPADYLEAIENATDSGPVVHDLPLSVPGDTVPTEKWSRERALTVSARKAGPVTAPAQDSSVPGPSVRTPWIYLSEHGSDLPPVPLHAGSGPAPKKPRWHLPAYLESMKAAGTTTFYDLRGIDWIETQIETSTGGGSPQEILTALDEAPETFLNHGRSFQIEGRDGWYDVTVAMNRHPDEPRPLITVLGTPSAPAGTTAGTKAEAHTAAVERSSLAVTGRATQDTRGLVLSGNGYFLIPVPDIPVPALAGAALNVNFSFRRHVTTRAEQHTSGQIHVLISADGTVKVPRRVQWNLRIQKAGVPNARSLKGDGQAIAKVPLAELVPEKEPSRLGPTRRIDAATARRIALAPSLLPLWADPGAPYSGGRGVFDAITTQLHPALVGPGTRGRSDAHSASRVDVFTRELPRMLNGWTLSEDLAASWGKNTGGYRIRAAITEMTPVIRRPGTDKQSLETGSPSFPTLVSLQLAARKHAVQDDEAHGGSVELGPGAGFVLPPTGPRVRFFFQPGLALAWSRWSALSQQGTTLQGAAIGGDRVLYLARLRVEVEGTGPTSPRTRRGPSVAHVRAWLYLRAEEAADLGLPLPPGMKPNPLFTHPGFERRLAVGLAATSTVWSGLDTAPLLDSLGRLFADDPRLKGFLPAFGRRDDVPVWRSSENEGRRMRANQRELDNKLSPAYLYDNRKALTTLGVQVQLVRKTPLSTDHAVVRVRFGQGGPIRYLGDVDSWQLLYGPELTSELLAGENRRRGVSLRFRLNSTLVPGHLYLNGTFGGVYSGVRDGQGGTLLGTATGSLSEGQDLVSAFGTALPVEVDVTLVSRPRGLRRVATPGSPGRQTPQTRLIATTGARSDRSTAALSVPPAPVRLTAPTSLTHSGPQPSGDALRPAAGPLPPAVPLPVPPLRGLSDMFETGWAPPWPGERRITQWQLLENSGVARFLYDRALELLIAASGDGDGALGTPELDPARKINEVFGPDAVDEGFEIATHHVWLADNLHFDRRVHDLLGAVGVRLHAVRPRIRDVAGGPPTDAVAIGGHQATGNRMRGPSASAEFFLGGAGSLAKLVWQLGGTGYARTWNWARESSSGVSVKVKYSTSTEPGERMVLVQADLDVLMAAEVSVRGRTPNLETYGGKLPGVAWVWLSETQVRELGMAEELEEFLARPSMEISSSAPPAPPLPATVSTEPADSSGTPAEETDGGPAETPADETTDAPAGPSVTTPVDEPVTEPVTAPADKAADLRLENNGAVIFGKLEKTPDLSRLLPALRTELARLRGQKFADRVLPPHLVADRHSNTQRLMAVLSRVGFRGLQAGVTDGGVKVTLYEPDGKVAYVARLTGRRGTGVFHGRPTDRKSLTFAAEVGMERSRGTVRSVTDTTNTAIFGIGDVAGDKGGTIPYTAALPVGSTAAAAHVDSVKHGFKKKLTASADAPALYMRSSFTASLELFAPGQDEDGDPAAVVPLSAPAEGEDDRRLVQRMLESDVRALAGMRPARALPAPDWQPAARTPSLARWRGNGAPVSPESHVFSFAGTPQIQAGLRRLLAGLKASKDFHMTGTVPSLTVDDALATEWITSMLPTLAAVGGSLPDHLVSGLPKGKKLRLQANARFTNGEILGVGEPMTFEYTPGVTSGHLRTAEETAATVNAAVESGGSPPVGGGWLNPAHSAVQQYIATGNRALARTMVSESARVSGELPFTVVIDESVLVQFDVDLRLEAELEDSAADSSRIQEVSGEDTATSRPADGESATTSIGSIEIPLHVPMALRMGRSSAEQLLTAGHIDDPGLHLAPLLGETGTMLAATDEELSFEPSQAPEPAGEELPTPVVPVLLPPGFNDADARLLRAFDAGDASTAPAEGGPDPMAEAIEQAVEDGLADGSFAFPTLLTRDAEFDGLVAEGINALAESLDGGEWLGEIRDALLDRAADLTGDVHGRITEALGAEETAEPGGEGVQDRQRDERHERHDQPQIQPQIQDQTQEQPQNQEEPPREDPPEAPWYLEHGALGHAFTQRADMPSWALAPRAVAEDWADAVLDGLRAHAAPGDEALYAPLRTALVDLLLTTDPKQWNELLAKGRMLVADGRLVWLRPQLRDPRPQARKAPGAVRDYSVGFAATATGGERSRDVAHGFESALTTAINTASRAASVLLLGLPSISAQVSRKKVRKWKRDVVSGRKLFMSDTTGFDADVEMRIFVDGQERRHGVVTPRELGVGLPADYSVPGAPRPDDSVPEPPAAPRREGDTEGPFRTPTRAKITLNALEVTDIVAQLQGALRVAGLSADAALKATAQAQATINERSLLNRSRWLLTSGDLTNPVHIATVAAKSFRGHFHIHAQIESVQYLGTTEGVGVRDDMGGGLSAEQKKDGGTKAGAAFLANILGGTKDGDIADGFFPAFGPKATSERSEGHSHNTQGQLHTVLNTRADQARYRSRLRLTVTTSSTSHTVAPATGSVTGELGMPLREAGDFEHRLLGAVATPALLHGPLPPGPVTAQPWVRALLRASDTAPVRTTTRPPRLDLPLPPPHPREPLALATRKGQGLGMLSDLPGSELVLEQLRWAIRNDLGDKAGKADWTVADKDLLMFFGTPALESDLPTLLNGIAHTVTVGGRTYRAGVRGHLLERLEDASSTYPRTVNARAVSARKAAGHLKRKWAGEVGFGGGVRLAIRDWFRVQLGMFRLIGSGGKDVSHELSGSVKSYRRTETTKDVDEHGYNIVYELFLHPDPDDPDSTPTTWWIDRPGENIALVDVPHQHVPAVPPTSAQLRAAGQWAVSSIVPGADAPRMAFEQGGTSGVYPAFLTMPQLANLAAFLHARINGMPEEEARKWSEDWKNWPDPIRNATTPTELANQFDALAGTAGWVLDLPDRDGHKQAVRLRLRALNPTDLGPTPAEDGTEIEHYLQAADHHQQGVEYNEGLEFAGSGGPQFLLGSDAAQEQDEGDEEGHGAPAREEKGKGPGGRFILAFPFGRQRKWGQSGKRKSGNIAITRATYGGVTHTVRTTPVFEVTAMRWMGDTWEETTRHLAVRDALDLLVPERRMEDLLPGAAPAPRERSAPRTVAYPAMLPGIAHPELLKADDVLPAILSRLRARGVLRKEGDGGNRPNLLLRTLTDTYSSERMEARHSSLITSGIRRWIPVPGLFGVTRYLWIKVTAVPQPATDDRPRPDVTLTLRSEGITEEETEDSVTDRFHGGFHFSTRGGVGGEHGGAEFGAGYESKTSRGQGEAREIKDIYRTAPKDTAHEFTHPMVFRIEMGMSTRPPAIVELPVRGAKWALFTLGRKLGTDTLHRLWEAHRPWTWHEDSAAAGGSPVTGTARLLVPQHLTVPAGTGTGTVTDAEVESVAAHLPPSPGTNPRWERTTKADRHAPAPMTGTPPRELIDNLHPWAVPAAAAVQLWAPSTARRYAKDKAPDLTGGRPPRTAGLLNDLTRPRFEHYTDEGMLKANIAPLLLGAYPVPVGDDTVLVGLELTAAHPLLPEAVARFKARRYQQDDQAPSSSREEASGWSLAFGPEGGDSHDNGHLIERAPFDLVAVEDGEKHDYKVAETDESNKEGTRHFRHFAFDARLVLHGPGGTVRLDVDHALFGKLPLAEDGRTLVGGLQDALQPLLDAARTTSSSPLPTIEETDETDETGETDGTGEPAETTAGRPGPSGVPPRQNDPAPAFPPAELWNAPHNDGRGGRSRPSRPGLRPAPPAEGPVLTVDAGGADPQSIGWLRNTAGQGLTVMADEPSVGAPQLLYLLFRQAGWGRVPPGWLLQGNTAEVFPAGNTYRFTVLTGGGRTARTLQYQVRVQLDPRRGDARPGPEGRAGTDAAPDTPVRNQAALETAWQIGAVLQQAGYPVALTGGAVANLYGSPRPITDLNFLVFTGGGEISVPLVNNMVSAGITGVNGEWFGAAPQGGRTVTGTVGEVSVTLTPTAEPYQDVVPVNGIPVREHQKVLVDAGVALALGSPRELPKRLFDLLHILGDQPDANVAAFENLQDARTREYQARGGKGHGEIVFLGNLAGLVIGTPQEQLEAMWSRFGATEESLQTLRGNLTTLLDAYHLGARPYNDLIITLGHFTGDSFGLTAALLHNPELHVLVAYDDSEVPDRISSFIRRSLTAPAHNRYTVELRALGDGVTPEQESALRQRRDAEVESQLRRVHLLKTYNARGVYDNAKYGTAMGDESQKADPPVPPELLDVRSQKPVDHGTRIVANLWDPQSSPGMLKDAWGLGADPEADGKVRDFLAARGISGDGPFAVLWSRFEGKVKGKSHPQHDIGITGLRQLIGLVPAGTTVLVAGDAIPGGFAKLESAAGARTVHDLTGFWESPEWRQAFPEPDRTTQMRVFDYLARSADGRLRHLGFRSGNLESYALIGHQVRYLEEAGNMQAKRMQVWHDTVGYGRITVDRVPTLSGQWVVAMVNRTGFEKRLHWRKAPTEDRAKALKQEALTAVNLTREHRGFLPEDLAAVQSYLLLDAVRQPAPGARSDTGPAPVFPEAAAWNSPDPGSDARSHDGSDTDSETSSVVPATDWTQLLEHALGARPDDAGFGDFVAGFDVLDAARAADGELSRYPLDLGVLGEMARRVLHLPGGEQLTRDHLWELYDVAVSAADAGRAGGVAALAAFHLDDYLGVLEEPGGVDTPGGRLPGRNWLGRPVPPLDLDRTGVLRGGTADPRDAKWAGERPYVLLADGDHQRVAVLDPVGNVYWVGAEELAELLRHDPLMPPDGAVVFLVSGAGAGGLELPRLVADRLGGANRTVWATDGRIVFRPDPGTGAFRALLHDHSPGRVPVGRWIPSRPGYVLPPGTAPGFFTTVDGQVYPDSRLMRYTILTQDGMDVQGWASVSGEDQIGEGEAGYSGLSAVRHWRRVYTHRASVGPLHDLEGPEIGYSVVGHGSRTGVDLHLDDGTKVDVDYGQLGGIMRRRPSFRKLRADRAGQVHFCQAGGRAPGSDPLVTPRNGQQTANTAGAMVRAMPTEVSFGSLGGGEPEALGLRNTTDDPKAVPRMFHPEPSAQALLELADRYLRLDHLPPVERRERVLRMVRAVSEVFGTGPEARLLDAFGRLERMRLADPAYAGAGSAPLTWALLRHIAGQYLARQPGEVAPRSEYAVLRELLGKALDPRAGAPGLTLTGFIEQSAALAEPADPLPAALDPAAWDDGPPETWTDVASLPAPAATEQAPVFPESAAWNSPGTGGDPFAGFDALLAAAAVTDRVRLLEDALGLRPGDSGFDDHLAGLDFLDAARAADTELSARPLDLGVLGEMAHRVLHLSRGHQITGDDHRRLFQVMGQAVQAGRAGSVATLAAFHLDRYLGVLSGPDGVDTPTGRLPGRNWLGLAFGSLDLDRVGVSGGNTLKLERAKWAGERPYVLLADGDHQTVTVTDPAGDVYWVGAEELAELLRHDPVMPPDGPVVFLVGGAGARGLELPRLVADRLGGANRTVWTTNGDITFRQAPGRSTTHALLHRHSPGQAPVGRWIPSRPGYVLPPGTAPGFFTTVDGQEYPDSRLTRYTLLTGDGMDVLGWSSESAQDTAVAEEQEYPHLPAVRHWRRNYQHRDVRGPLHALEGPEIGYWVVGHGSRGDIALHLDDGTAVRVDHGELGGIMRRRPSFRKLRLDQAAQVHFCHVGGQAPGSDPLVTPRNGQKTANATRSVVGATPTQVRLEQPVGGDPAALWLRNATDEPEVVPRVFYPEPPAQALLSMADRYLGLGHLSPVERRERVLRMVRAVSEVFGTGPEARLLDAFGRLERMRLADPAYAGDRSGPLTWALLVEIAGRYENWQTGLAGSRSEIVVLRELLGKALNPRAGAPGMTLTGFIEQSAALAEPADPLPAALDPAAWDDGPLPGGQNVQPSPAQPLPAQPSREERAEQAGPSGTPRDGSDPAPVFPESGTWNSPGNQSATPTPTAEREQLLYDAMGVRPGDASFDDLTAEFDTLDAARAADTRLSRRPLDLDVLREMTRRILHLPRGHWVTRDDLWNLSSVVTHAVQANRAGSVAALAAFHLDDYRGVFMGPDGVNTPNGRLPGRNWLGTAVEPLNLDRVGVFDGELLLEDAKWAGERPYVLLAEGDEEAIGVRGQTGGVYWVEAEELAELLRHDPVMPPDGPVVFLVDRAGAGGLELPRLVADRLGGANRTVWTTNRYLVYRRSARTGDIHALLDDYRPGRVPVGHWIPSRPGYVLPPGTAPGYFRTVDGQEYPDSRLTRYTILTGDGMDVLGWSSESAQDTAEAEKDEYPYMSAVRHWRRNYWNRDVRGPLHALEGPEIGYWVVGHGSREGVALHLDDGTAVRVDHGELGGIMRRRPSFRKLRADQAAQVHFCHVGGQAPGSDPLAVPRNGQKTANIAGSMVRATPTQVRLKHPVGGDPAALWLRNTTDEPEVVPRVFHPEPSGEGLLELADRHLGLDHLPPVERQERALRMVRAVSEVFGTGPEARLLDAFGRLERMRLADPAYAGDRSGPLTWALLVEIAGRYENWQTGLAGSRSEIVVLRELLGKALNPRAGAPGMTLTGFIEQSAALAEPADPLPAALDPAAWDDGPLPGGQNVQPSPAQPLP
ncbi:hypothetical protein CUT44_18870, partial [Streptomyces carminius]